MSSAKRKGDERERQARDIYERAGFAVQPFYGRKYGETDGFGMADFVAVRNHHRAPSVVFGQVKSNGPDGIGDWFEHAWALLPWGVVKAHYLIAYDYAGWRLDKRAYGGGYTTVCDERELDCAMGDGLAEWLAV